MNRLIITVLLSGLISFSVFATQWQVGPGQTYTAPSQVAPLVNDGDTVNIEVGTYPSDVTNWTADDLLLRGVGGMAHLESNGNAWGGKGIWVIQGDRNTVEYMEFSECSVPDNIGAGIRFEGKHLTVRHCYFHYNENGILAGTQAAVPSNIIIENCEFAHNGFGDGFSHNLYINYTDTLVFRYNYSHHTNVGHEIKSRARVNFIEYNRFSNEDNGTASREIDLPDGGQAYVIGNVLHQGLQGSNSNMIGFAHEGLTNPGLNVLYAINNTMVNTRSVGSFFSFGPGSITFKAYNNILAGSGQFVAGGSLPAVHDTLANKQDEIFAAFNFVSPNSYDYHIQPGSIAQSGGIPAGNSLSGYPLVAWDEYVHPVSSIERCQHALLDVGAFEICTLGLFEQGDQGSLALWPNPTADLLYVLVSSANSVVTLYDCNGREVLVSKSRNGSVYLLDIRLLPSGIYLVRETDGRNSSVQRVVVER